MFYLTTHSAHFIYGHMVKDHSAQDEGRKWGFLTTHSAHFIYGIGPLTTRGRKEMYYLMTNSAHFIYGHMVKDHSTQEEGRKELGGGGGFNDAHFIFGYMVKDH